MSQVSILSIKRLEVWTFHGSYETVAMIKQLEYILQNLNQSISSNIFKCDVRTNAVRASITVVHIRKIYKNGSKYHSIQILF